MMEEPDFTTLFGYEVAPEFQKCMKIEYLIYRLEESSLEETVNKLKEYTDEFDKDYIYRVIITANDCYIFKTELYGKLWLALGWEQKYLLGNDFDIYIAKLTKNQKLLQDFGYDDEIVLENYTHLNLPPFFNAILCNYIQDVQRLINEDPSNIDSDVYLKADNLSVLEFCALLGNFLLFKFFVAKGCRISDATIEYAIRGGNLNIISNIINQGFNLEPYFEVALEFHQTRLAELLIRRLPDEDTILNALKGTIRGLNTAGLYLFKIFGIEFDKIQSSSRFILHLASYWGNIILAKYLIEVAGAYVNKINKNGYSPLHYACRGGNFELIKYLISKGADINMRSGFGELLERKFQPWQTEEEIYYIKCKTPVPPVSTYNFSPDPFFQDTSAYLNHGKTPLMIALNGFHLCLVSYLLDIGADKTIKDNKGHDYDYYLAKF